MRTTDHLRLPYRVILAGLFVTLSGCVAVPDVAPPEAPPAPDPIVPEAVVRAPERPVLPDLPAVPAQPDVPDEPEVPEAPFARPPEHPTEPLDPQAWGMPLPKHPPRVLPRPAGPGPDRRQQAALLRYVRRVQREQFRGQQPVIHSDLPQPLLQIARELVSRDVPEILMDRWYEQRGDVHYGRVDLTVHPPGWFAEFLPEITMRGPTVFSGLSEIDAQLNSLHRFPAGAPGAAQREIQRAMERLVRHRGVFYRVEYESISDPHEREWIDAALRSIGRPDDRHSHPTGRCWWLYLPPDDALGYLEQVLSHLSLQIVVVNQTNTLMMVYTKE